MQKTTRLGLQERHNASLIVPPSEESLNSKSFETLYNEENSMPQSHSGSGYNIQKDARISGHNVFVLGVDGKPLTPTTNAKARKLMEGNQAKPIWNKFGKFGIEMLVPTGKNTPKTALGVDFGTKFEGYAVAVGKENNLAVMWKLPHKKNIVKKLEERRQLRRARRWRNCRRRASRFDNRSKKNFIAPSQMVIVQSRLKAMQEFFRCYPIDTVALEDVRFNHRDNRWGKNFSTIEIGKKRINDWIRERAYLQFFTGMDTQALRKEYGYKKSSQKSAEVFNAHCSDALALATSVSTKRHIFQGKFVVVDDTYRYKRRKLHDTQFAKGGIRDKDSSGNFRGIRKGTICNFGQICGGIKEKTIRIYDWNNKRLAKNFDKIAWLSHSFKTKEGAIPPTAKAVGVLAHV